jgi:4-amino-4-deoxy-L-arabinose transferase-like glycosyltransferase
LNQSVELLPPVIAEETPIVAKRSKANRSALLVVLIAAVIYCCGMLSPPSLMDDVDSVQAQIAKNMLHSGDYVTARLDGVPYLEKSPLIYWLIAACFRIFGFHDWAARIPIAMGAIALCWLVSRVARWAFGPPADLYAGLSLASCIGLYLFTRVLIPDVLLTLAVAAALYSYYRALEPDEDRHFAWAAVGSAAVALGLLLKGLIGFVFPIGVELAYLLITRRMFLRRTWRRLHVLTSAFIGCIIAAPWHVIATLRNPPYFSFSMVSRPGEYHGFFWFYFINEHVLRFLNQRYPRDYNTVPVPLFWLLNLAWLFPFVVYLPAVFRQSFRPDDRGGRLRLLALCWIGVVMVFFSFSTTQEYYSMPIYPALALLIGSAATVESGWFRLGNRIVAAIAAAAGIACLSILWFVRHVPTPGDIADALNVGGAGGRYTLSLGHALDLTLNSFAYLRAPLAVAGLAFVGGAVLLLVFRKGRALFVLAGMMLLFFQAARMAMVTFDPYLSTRPLATALQKAPAGGLISDGAYYTFSSVIFYADRPPLILNGRVNNLVYGSYAPGAPNVFIDDDEFKRLWSSPQRYYLLTPRTDVAHIEEIASKDRMFVVAEGGAKYLISNFKP